MNFHQFIAANIFVLMVAYLTYMPVRLFLDLFYGFPLRKQ